MSYVQLRSGIRFYPYDPRPEDVDINDIAWSLSNICRFTGHTAEFLSVAEHSVMVSKLVPSGQALLGLMHDASEAYVGDMASPLKCRNHEFRLVEARVWLAIRKRFNLSELTPDVKDADMLAMSAEVHALMPDASDFPGLPPPPKIRPQCWDPKTAREEFIFRFRELTQ
jgi:hypothetical protein